MLLLKMILKINLSSEAKDDGPKKNGSDDFNCCDNEDAECPICGVKIAEKSVLRRHLMEEHHHSMIDAISIMNKETPLSSSLPTLVRPTGIIEPSTNNYIQDEGMCKFVF